MADLAQRRSKLSATKRDLLEKILRAGDTTTAGQTIPKHNSEKPLLLSFAQQRLWFLEQLTPGSATYNISRKVVFTGLLSVPSLRQSLNEIVRRHESLRTSFRMVEGELVQWVETPAAFPLEKIELTGVSDREQTKEVDRLARHQAQHVFDLARGPMLRAALLCFSERAHVLLLTIHHAVTDGWSMDLLLRELAILYDSFAAGRPSPLPELPIQYADFSSWQRQYLEDGNLEPQLGYWKQQLSDAAPTLELPTDKPRPLAPQSNGARHTFRISAELTQALHDLAQREGVSRLILLVAVFNVLLYRYSGQDDISVGVPAAERSPRELEGLVGLFVNTLVLRTRLRSDMSFQELLRTTRDTALSAYEHQGLPFEKLVGALQAKRDTTRSPLFQVMFTLHSAWFNEWTMAGVECVAEVVNSDTSQFELSLDITEAGQELRGVFEYRTELFEDATIARMSRHFENLLQAVVTEPHGQLSELPLLSTEERHQLLLQGATGRTDYPAEKCIHHLFEEQAASTPEAVAIAFGEQQLTYQQLNERASRLASYLQKRGLKVNQPVALCVDQGIEMAVGILGILKAGGAYLPLDPALPRERIIFMLQDAAVSLVVTQARWTEKLRDCGLEMVSLDSDWEIIGKESGVAPAVTVSPVNAAYIIYTSGTTGRPKGVVVPHRALVNHGLELARVQKLAPGDRVLQFNSISFDVAAEELFPTWSSGATVVTKANQAPAPAEFLRLLKTEQVTVVNIPTAYWHLWVDDLARSGEQLPANLRLVVVGGEKALSERLETWWKTVDRGVRLLNAYGPTETTVSATVIEPSKASWIRRGSSIPIGRPIRNVQTYVLDAHLEPVPLGVVGELYIGGRGLAHGYLGQPELTAERFIPNPFAEFPGERLYRTGDVVRYLPDTAIEFVGRNDQQVKVRGYRIELAEIEAVLSAHEEVRESAVVVQEYAPGEHRLIAYFVTVNERGTTGPELRRYLRERLPEYMVPSAFVKLENLPLTPNKKVDRKALSTFDLFLTDARTTSDLPRTPVEGTLLEIWARVLGIDGLGIHDDFFALGGHSLLGMKLIALAEEVFHVELPMRRLFERPTVAAFAESIETALLEGSGASRLPVKRVKLGGELPLSFNQEARLFRDWWAGLHRAVVAPFQIHIGLRLNGKLDIAALQRAFNGLLQRHDVLRATFQPPRGLLGHRIFHPIIDRVLSWPVTQKRLRKVSKKNVWKSSFFRQTINPPLSLEIPLVDLREFSATDLEAEVQRLAVEEANKVIDYTKDPLLRALLIKVRDDEHVLVFLVHHLATDGWSFQLLLEELAQDYQAFASNQPSPIPEPPVRYADFAYWQREQMQAEVRDRLVSYWHKRFANFPLTPELILPFALPRTGPPTYRGATQSIVIPPELYVALRQVMRQQKVTMYMLLLATFITLLARYTGRERLGLLVLFANRNRLETQSLMGWLANVHVFNSDLSDTPRFVDLLERVRATIIEDYAHQEIPYTLLFGELLQRTKNYTMPKRVFETPYVFFDLRIEDETPFQVPGLTVSPVEIPSRFADELAMYAIETAGKLKIKVHYTRDRFTDSSMVQLLADFEELLRQVSIEPATPLSALTHEGDKSAADNP